MKEFLSYDIEIYEDLPEGENVDLSKINPSVAAFCTDYENIHYYDDVPHMSKVKAQNLVLDLQKKVDEGFTLFTWNGLTLIYTCLLSILGCWKNVEDWLSIM